MLGPFPFGPKFQAFETRRCLRELALMIVFFRTATSHLDVEPTEGVSGGVLIELHLQPGQPHTLCGDDDSRRSDRRVRSSCAPLPSDDMIAIAKVARGTSRC